MTWTALYSADFETAIQRRTGLYYAAAKPTLDALAELGVQVDYHGDDLAAAANRSRTHRQGLGAWCAAARACSHACMLLFRGNVSLSCKSIS